MISRSVRSVAISFFFALILDQMSKHFATGVIVNSGISFGLFSSGFLTVVLVIIFLEIAKHYGKQFVAMSPVSAGIFFGASASNLLDRIRFGGVRDFLPVPFLGLRNNLADWCIILSLLWILWNSTKTSFSKTKHSSS